MGPILVDILAPALTFPSNLSQSEIISGTSLSLGLPEDQLEFLSLGESHLCCLIKNSKFSLDFIESLYQENTLLHHRFEKSAEAVEALQESLMQTTQQLQEKQSLIYQQHQTMTMLSHKERQLSEELNQWKNKYEEELYKRKKNEKRIERMRMPKNGSTTPTNSNNNNSNNNSNNNNSNSSNNSNSNNSSNPMYLINSPTPSPSMLTSTAAMSPYLEREIERHKDREIEFKKERQQLLDQQLQQHAVQQVTQAAQLKSPSISPSTSSNSINTLTNNICNTSNNNNNNNNNSNSSNSNNNCNSIIVGINSLSSGNLQSKLNSVATYAGCNNENTAALIQDRHSKRSSSLSSQTSPIRFTVTPTPVKKTPCSTPTTPISSSIPNLNDFKSPSSPYKSHNQSVQSPNFRETELFVNCRQCKCNIFRETQLKWVCDCGHLKITHKPCNEKALSPRPNSSSSSSSTSSASSPSPSLN
ncbi:hypothetical protein PPL_07796 [Heterostelium album PN500]|uniref:Uncharacterized protein n=1 Tax=Heterostelium pallidum (strain ATCC 26659 / Pp 5 / PN500) TaxID=670386 RepID=D3BGZ4_HETP5|nr:hypothetical protein PPL_07796 [Heterostelium album PN500]EFA79378.1 hypothetical protein PPL_07796 [Heterostelium album PN500]|eukprot:XP_020431499.1 hypothetical protein PPL_07796 [Heterostelium album PN500]